MTLLSTLTFMALIRPRCTRRIADGKLREARVHGQERRNSHGTDGGGICGGWDADRYDGGGGCEPPGILPGDGGAGGEGECGMKEAAAGLQFDSLKLHGN